MFILYMFGRRIINKIEFINGLSNETDDDNSLVNGYDTDREVTELSQADARSQRSNSTIDVVSNSMENCEYNDQQNEGKRESPSSFSTF